MIRNSESIIAKIFFDGKVIQKVYKQGIQVFPDAGFQKYFWLKVFDEDDQKTYYYHCTQTNVVYQDGSTEIIKEIYYTAGQKQENSPGEDQQIYELLNDQVKITGQDFLENDFESFVDKSQEEVIAMTPKYQEKLKDLVNLIPGMEKYKEIFVSDGLITYQTLPKQDIIQNGKGFANLSGVPDDYQYNYSNYTNTAGNKVYQIIFKNISNTEQDFYYITTGQYPNYTYCNTFVSDNIDKFKTYVTYNSIPETDGNGWTTNKSKTRGILCNVKIPANSYISCYIILKLKAATETFYNTFCYKEKSISIIDGNFLNHKYISDTTHEIIIRKFKYNFAYAMIKHDLNKKVYQTNCKYIISKDEIPGLLTNNVLKIPEKSIGWNLLYGKEYKEYAANGSKYKIMLTFNMIKGSYGYLWGVLKKKIDISGPKYNLVCGDDFLTYYYSDQSEYISINTKNIVTCIWNSYDKKWEVWQDGQKKTEWDYSGFTEYVFEDNDEIHLNSYLYITNLPEHSFYFYEFKIVDSNTGDIVKRIVPSNDRTKLWECVSGKFIEPCRTVSDEANLPVLLDNLKLGVETKDGLGNKIKDWVIY